MTPEEVAECRAARDRFLAGNSSQVILAEILSTMLEHIDSQAGEIKWQKEDIRRLKAESDDLSIRHERLTGAIKLEAIKIAEQAAEIKQANHRYADLQNICDDQDKEIKRLEDALVEERARRICHQPRDKVGHWPRYEDLVVDEARAQLRAEGAIR